MKSQPETGRLLTCITTAMVLGLGAGQLPAQVATGSIVVEIVVGEEAPVPGVPVVVVNIDTGIDRRGVSDDTGRTFFGALPPGDYRVSAELAGFETPGDAECVVRVGETLRLRLNLLPLVEETIDVSGEAPLVDVYRSETAANVTPEQIRELPVIDRKFERLALLTPGVQPDRVEYFDRAGSPVIGAGAGGGQTTYMVDGVELTDPFSGLARQRLSQDAVREFRVSRQGYDAELGASATGVISIVTHSGTNEVRGTVYGFYRADALRSPGALELEDADFTRYQVGVALGGPLVRDRTHYFFSLEHLDDNQVAFVRPGGHWVDQAADVPAPVEQTSILFSLDHRFSSSSTGSARLSWERYRRKNYNVGGVRDESNGWGWNRDPWTVVLGHTWVVDDHRLNELRGQLGSSGGDFPVNSTELTEYFRAGATLQTGGHWVGPGCAGSGDIAEIRDTYSWQPGSGRHQLKTGLSWWHFSQIYREDRFEWGPLIYLSDDRTDPAIYYYGKGSSLTERKTDFVSAFVHDDWRPTDNLTVGMGLRYDIDIGGNNPDFDHPLLPGERGVDTNNIQPRLSVAWDLTGDGTTVLRGGVGRFVSRFPYYFAMSELQFHGFDSRTLRRNVSVPDFEIWIDPADPENTGLALAPDVYLLGDEAPSPESTQAGLGLSKRLGSTGLRLEVDAVYIKGRNELAWMDSNWRGNDDPCQNDPTTAAFTCRINPDYTWIYRYVNEGRSRYRGLTIAVNGTLVGGHLLNAAFTVADKKNIADDLADTAALPSDPANLDGEWGRSKTDERYRLIVSGVFRLPWRLTLAPVYEYGSGQPWNRVLGYDANKDGEFTDRGEGVPRNDQDGPSFSQLSLRLTKGIVLGRGELDLVLEVFNLFNTTNYNVGSVVPQEYLVEDVPNPEFGTYTATLPPREIQLGLRYSF